MDALRHRCRHWLQNPLDELSDAPVLDPLALLCSAGKLQAMLCWAVRLIVPAHCRVATDDHST